ncbi:MAG TPA: hypothetical protein VKR58_00770, partial [Aquella sp.]|nr:hypothetical protein [Aquella sp.]
MALLKKLLNKSESASLFPQQIKATPVNTNTDNSPISLKEVSKLLTEDSEFIDLISESVTNR